jgi:hypothetical protein
LTEALAGTSKATGLEVHAEKTQYMIIPCDQNAGQNHNKETGKTPLKTWNSSDIQNNPNKSKFHS